MLCVECLGRLIPHFLQSIPDQVLAALAHMCQLEEPTAKDVTIFSRGLLALLTIAALKDRETGGWIFVKKRKKVTLAANR